MRTNFPGVLASRRENKENEINFPPVPSFLESKAYPGRSEWIVHTLTTDVQPGTGIQCELHPIRGALLMQHATDKRPAQL